MRTPVLLLLAPLIGAAAPQPSRLDIEVGNLRNTRGTIHACLSADPRFFPDCRSDPKALKRSVPAKFAGILQYSGFPAGHYALTLFHDENDNQRLDTVLGVPKEGFAFSRNPKVRFGPPRFEAVVFSLGEGVTRKRLRMQYLL